MPKLLTFRLAVAVLLAAVLMTLVIRAASDPTNPYRQADAVAGVVKTLRENYVEVLSEDEQREMMQQALTGMVASLGDPHSGYMPPVQFAEFEDEIEGTFVGIGAHVDSYEGLVRVTAPIPGSPAAKAGIRPGDLVVEVDGVSTLGMELTDAVDRIKGEAGTEVTLKVRRKNGDQTQEMTVTVERGTVQVPAIMGFVADAEGNPDFMLDPETGIGYVFLREFTARSGEQVLAASQEAQARGAKALILDLRNNPGGLLTQAIDVADVFLPPEQLVLSVRGRGDDQEEHVTRRPAGVEPGLPLCVLVNEQSASAAEIVAGALQDHGRAYIVGARTYGKGSVQQPFPLTRGLGAVRLTVARWYLPSGRLLHRDYDEPDQPWGVDPSAGGYVPIGPEAYFEWLGKRQDLLAGVLAVPVSGINRVWLDDVLSDPQLGLAYEAARQRIVEGVWPELSVFDADTAQAQAELEALKDEKLMLEKQMLDVEKRIAELTETERSLGLEAEVKTGVEELVP